MIGKDVYCAFKYLREGKIVAIPTETVYGLAANIYLPDAIKEIFKVKNRPIFDPLIVHSSCFEQIKSLVEYIPDKAIVLAKKFWPGPLTMVLPKSKIINPLITSGMNTVALRIPAHPLTLSLLKKTLFPLVAPSANPFGYISPTSAKDVFDFFEDKIPYILDGGICSLGIESTIVEFKKDSPFVLRKGALKVENIEKVIGKIKILSGDSFSHPRAPGMLKNHYAPKTKILLGNIRSLIAQNRGKKIGILSFSSIFEEIQREKQFILSPKRSFQEAARNLFSYMRKLDKLRLDMILAELLPEKDLGIAINDRLRKASLN